MAQDKKQSFMKGAAILSASTLLVKLLGLLFSIPLANFIDPEGMSHFYIAYNIFGLFLMLSTAGLPVAVSRMVGTATSQGRLREADRVFSVAFWLFFFLGLFGCLVMFFGANQIAQWYGSPESNYAIMALAPTLFFISIESVSYTHLVASVKHRASTVAKFPAFLQDVKSAIRFLRAHADTYCIDPNQVGIWGDSSGGHAAQMVGVTGDMGEFKTSDNGEISDAVQAVVDFYGPSDVTHINDAPR